MYQGIINIKKEAGFTSHDVVAKLRGILKQKKIGHTGTLDPDAVGVLPVCLGKATKLCDMISDWDKCYSAVLLLGTETDTEDTSGTVLQTQEVNVGEEEVKKVIMSFIGPYDQIPPMYSAKKVDGKKLYELAREGKIIERKPCHVEITEIEIKSINLPYVTFDVKCSKGTYIRSLCRDIGEELGCGGCMSHLTRTQVSQFKIEDAYTLSQVEKYRDLEILDSIIYPVDSVFEKLSKVSVGEKCSKMLYNGNKLSITDCDAKIDIHKDQKVRVYDAKGIFIGVYNYDHRIGILKPEKLFL